MDLALYGRLSHFPTSVVLEVRMAVLGMADTDPEPAVTRPKILRLALMRSAVPVAGSLVNAKFLLMLLAVSVLLILIAAQAVNVLEH